MWKIVIWHSAMTSSTHEFLSMGDAKEYIDSLRRWGRDVIADIYYDPDEP